MSVPIRFIIGRCALFISIFIAIVILLNMRMESMSPDHTAAQFHELLHSTNPADVIILGSSTAVHGYDPTILATLSGSSCNFARTFDFGFMGAQPPFYLQWYRLLFKRYYHAPSLVIVSLDWFSPEANDPHRIRVTLEQDSRYLPWDISFKLFLQGDNQIRIRLLMNMVRIMQAGPDVRYFFSQRDDPAMRGYDHGYMPLDGNINLASEGTRNFSVDESFLYDLSSLFDEIQSQGSKIVLVQMPIYTPKTIHNLDASRAFADLAQARGIPYIDYNGEYVSTLNAHASLFADWSHLNREGSKIFTMKFRDDLLGLIRKTGSLCK